MKTDVIAGMIAAERERIRLNILHSPLGILDHLAHQLASYMAAETYCQECGHHPDNHDSSFAGTCSARMKDGGHCDCIYHTLDIQFDQAKFLAKSCGEN